MYRVSKPQRRPTRASTRINERRLCEYVASGLPVQSAAFVVTLASQHADLSAGINRTDLVLENAKVANAHANLIFELTSMENAFDTHPLHHHPSSEAHHGGPLTQLKRDLISLHCHQINILHHSAHNVEALDEPDPDAWSVEVRYPSGYTERFRLNPNFKTSRRAKSAQTLEPSNDIVQTLQIVLQQIDCSVEILESLNLRLEVAWNHNSSDLFKSAISYFNELVHKQAMAGSIRQYMTGNLPREMISHFFDQLYDRAVSPHLNGLKSGKSDTVYGELRTGFLSEIFRALDLREDSVYLDLGSGVGNTAMQAALETGCEAHGIELAQHPHLIGAYHLQQFHARCALWDLHPGNVTLHFGDFLKSQLIGALLPEVDAVVVNNVKFEPTTDANLYNLLAKKLKLSAKVFSMRPLAPIGRARSPNGTSIISGDGIFQVEAHEYGEERVSWTDKGGVCYISTKRRVGG